MRLNETQALFARTMLDHPDAVDYPAPALAGLFTGDETSVPERLKIYRNNIVGSLTIALLATYPLIEKLTGKEFATHLMRSFALENPPQEACLARYGAGLDRFIANFAPARTLPWLADVARLEWAMNEAYYAPDDEPLTPADLQAMRQDAMADMTLNLRPSARLIDSRWPLESIRDFCLKEDRDESETLDLNQKGGPLMVYRPALSAVLVPLEPAAFVFLQTVAYGKTLGTALSATLQAYPTFDFQSFLQKNLSLETFSSSPANTP